MRTIIKNGILVDFKNKINKKLDILIEEDKVIEISENIEIKNSQTLDATGKHVFPGFVDAHCHLREPGYEYKEDIISGTMSAAKGGFTSIACMPNTNPIIDNATIVSFIINKANKEGYANVFPIGSITKGTNGNELSEIGELKFAGAVAISDDGKPVRSANVMKKAMQYAYSFDMPVISHCEELDLIGNGAMNEGLNSTIWGIPGIPSAAEEIMIARDTILSEYLEIPIHIAHVSTSLGVDLIRNAKKRGAKITCETCPHYFTLTDAACKDYNAFAKMNPPLRTQKDIDGVIEGLVDGTIDIIATDHAPHHIDEKNIEFELAANGIIGFETAFSLSYTYLVKTGKISLINLIDKMAFSPSKILKINKGFIEVGATADLAIVDIDDEYVINVKDFASKSINTPFNGHKVFGKVNHTILGGRIVVKSNKIV